MRLLQCFRPYATAAISTMGYCSYFGLAPLRFGYEAIIVFSALRHCSYFGHGPLQPFRLCAIERFCQEAIQVFFGLALLRFG